MPNAFGSSNISLSDSSWQVVGVFVVIAVLVVVGYVLWPSSAGSCPKTLHRDVDGSLRLDSGQVFPDMNAFQKWWHASRDYANCPLPVLTGARERPVMHNEDNDEQTFAKTPIYKVDDYEFSRVFGYERNGRMEVPRQNYNVLLNKRAFDWPDKPMSSDERRSKYMGLSEGFTAAGDLKSIVMAEPSAPDLVKEATQRYGEHHHRDHRHPSDDDVDCRVSREAREVAAMVAKAYEADPNYEPVITKVGANHWEVNELKPRHRKQEYEEPQHDKVVDTSNDATDIAFEYRERQAIDTAIDPYFTSTGDLPFQSERSADAWYGPVPGMERMFGPTFDHKKWY